MNKSELVKAFGEKYDLDAQAAADIVNLLFESIRQALNNGDRVEIRGFGSFSVREYEGYTGRNPKLGIDVTVKPKKLPFFKAGKELKEYLNRE